MSRSRRVWLATLSSAVAVAALVAIQPTQAQEESAGFLAGNGRTSYRLYCANCHGSEGRGNGNVAKFLTVKPADLTRIQQRHGGWPEDELYQIIDGRQEVKTHGRREMPIWGDVFQSPWADSVPVEQEEGKERADRKIRELIVFLRTIQIEE